MAKHKKSMEFWLTGTMKQVKEKAAPPNAKTPTALTFYSVWSKKTGRGGSDASRLSLGRPQRAAQPVIRLDS